VEQGTALTSITLTHSTTGNFRIGSAPAGTLLFHSWKGGLDNAAFYSTALSAARVLAHYNAGIVVGSTPRFAGHLTSVLQTQDESRDNLAYLVTASNYTWAFNRNRVNARYVGKSATAIIQDLIGRFAPSFTSYNVVAGLPTLDLIEFTNEDTLDAVARTMKRVGGYAALDFNRDVRAFLSDTTNPPDALGNSTGANFRNLQYRKDTTQLRNRSICEGGGSSCPVAVSAGSTYVPVDDPVWYAATGGWARVGPNRISYTGLVSNQDGALIGTSTSSPTSASTAAVRSGGGVTAGAHQYKVTFGTVAGETLAGPASNSVTTSGSGVSAPANLPPTYLTIVDYGTAGAGLNHGQTYNYAYTFYDPATGNETTPTLSTDFASFSPSDPNAKLTGGTGVDSLSTPPPGYVRRFYRTVGNGSVFKLLSGSLEGFDVQITNVFGTFRFESYTDAALGANAPSVNTLNQGQVLLSNIPISPSGSVNKRRIYRTAAGGTSFLLVATINDNTTLTFTDSVADGSLGAAEPATNTAGVTSVDDSLAAGSATIPVSSSTPFPSTGGYARVGQQVIRFTGKTTTTLTGVPTSGNGSLLSTVKYGTTIQNVAILTGLPLVDAGSLQFDVRQNDTVNVLGLIEDPNAQASVFGIVEHEFSDNRLTALSAQQYAEADLALYQNPIETITYDSRDPKTVVGKTVTVNYTVNTTDDAGNPVSTVINATFKIQAVNFPELDTLPGEEPWRQVTASSVMFTFEDMLRQLTA
jgi:hypothetical protein